METEKFHVLEEKEEKRDTTGCPYKNIKFEDESFNEEASFVTNNANPQAMDSSNGCGVGIYHGNPQVSAFDGELLGDKIIMDEKGRNDFEVLPEGWVQVTHDSGMPLYLHRDSRVCLLSRPYFLGPGPVHQKALEKEKELTVEQQRVLKEQQEKEATMEAEEINGTNLAKLNLNKTPPSSSKAHLPLIPKAEVEAAENLKAHSLTPVQKFKFDG